MTEEKWLMALVTVLVCICAVASAGSAVGWFLTTSAAPAAAPFAPALGIVIAGN